MLILQRASAGSGKTFSLTRRYLWLLLTIEDRDSHRRRLRTGPELADSARHILAITFTNKATNEMKGRIVSKLADIARAGESGNATYVAEFTARLDVTAGELSKVATEALRILLLNYSDFNVSTIDSFFQTVLRTFAYESSLNDSYGLELEDREVVKAAFADTLQQLNSEGSSSDDRYWFSLLMEDFRASSKAWNIFMEGAADSERSLLGILVRTALAMEKEEFKILRESLDSWFAENTSLVADYRRMKDFFEADAVRLAGEMRREARSFLAQLRSAGVDPEGELARYFPSRFAKMAGGKFDFSMKTLPKSVFAKNSEFRDTADGEYLDSVGLAICGKFMEYAGIVGSESYRLWKLYSLRIPFLVILQSLRKNMESLLSDSNLLQLSETNSILKSIIGEDDTPFVYEKIGTRLNHLLIDEFQDTSRLQWHNLRPLLEETCSRGEENLIIGDAKQSIYRFRNADSTLISREVPETFRDIEVTGDSREENTNHRSDRRIVEFNNLVFGGVPSRIGEELAGLYSNAIQWPASREMKGYVELRSVTEEGKKKSTTDPYDPYMAEMGPLVASILDRGYSQKDIAFLISSHSEGEQLVEALMDYNASPAPGKRRINFISEDSLKISSSRAVGIVISALENIANPPSEDKIRTSQSGTGSERFSWRKMKTAFSFFSIRHPELEPHRQLEMFVREGAGENPLQTMLSGMRAFSLPALVEEIIVNFVPERLRNEDAIFISAFQDLLLEFCENSVPDVATFLDWWNSTGKSKGISSPESADAVRIMTIHQAKGLEYPCVIVPKGHFNLVPERKSEIRWVRPALSGLPDGMSLPPYLPLETSATDLKGTPHESVLEEYKADHCRDTLNRAYVAFTRAVSELYVYGQGRDEKHLFEFVCQTIEDFRNGNMSAGEGKEACLPDPESLNLTLPPKKEKGRRKGKEEEEKESGEDDSAGQTSVTVLTFGEKGKPHSSGKEKEDDGVRRVTMPGLPVSNGPSRLFAVPADDISASTDVADGGGDDEHQETADDPRHEGTLLHEVLQNVVRECDVEKALMRMVVAGKIDRGLSGELAGRLHEAFDKVRDLGWFSGDMEVLNERPLLIPGSSLKRPDRIMLDRDTRRGIVVDYKFGLVDDTGRYRKQILGYADTLAKTGLFDSVEAWLWFVTLGKVVRVR